MPSTLKPKRKGKLNVDVRIGIMWDFHDHEIWSLFLLRCLVPGATSYVELSMIHNISFLSWLDKKIAFPFVPNSRIRKINCRATISLRMLFPICWFQMVFFCLVVFEHSEIYKNPVRSPVLDRVCLLPRNISKLRVKHQVKLSYLGPVGENPYRDRQSPVPEESPQHFHIVLGHRQVQFYP